MKNNARSTPKADEVKTKTEDPSPSSPLTNPAAKSAANTGRYKIQGTIASIDLMDMSFTIDPISPYMFEPKEEDSTKKFMIFVASEDKASNIRGARILKCKPYFKAPAKVDLGAIIALKNGREKVELEVELKDVFDAEKDKIRITAFMTVK